ncbi:proteophosphoglycan ppg4 [Rhodotorula toruloides]|uniref:Proteophosphoglycan ppg4 n=1 Tax=Rhodotorula toruloides TaxID=5286 RepID=A0A511KQ87_RHOTO|nr:proteophosphoglycan ppg4 [Rhodotorula toruloides]
MASTAKDAPFEVAETAVEPTNPSWVSSYNSLTAKLPSPLSQRLPTGDQAAVTLALAQDKLAAFGNSSKERWDTVSRSTGERVAELRQSSSKGVSSVQDAWLAKAWSVTNETQVPLNVALRQVGPLYYDVLPPGATFERRVPNLWFSLEIRPYTSPASAYNGWSATWPILCVTGPAVAVTSLLAIPFVAAAAGGTALASLTGFGSSIVAGAGAAAESVGAAAATAVGIATKANAIPGASRVKGRLADAARDLVGEHISREKVQQHVVRYLTQQGGGGKGKEEAVSVGLIEDAQVQAVEKTRAKARKEKKLDEVDVTGYDTEKVLSCATGHAGVDKALAKAFKKLSFKTKFAEYRTQDCPVLRVAGGPELETRTPTPTFFHPNPSPKSFIVFYPFVLLHSTHITAEPVPASEVPPTEDEQRVMERAKVVESFEEAEKESLKGDDEVEVGAGDEAVFEMADAKGKKAEGGGEKKAKKGWFW